VPGVGILMLGMGGLGLFAWIPLSYYRMVMWPLILLWQAGFALILGWLIWRLRQFERPFRPLGYGWDGVMVATVLGLGLSAWGAPFKAIALWQLAWGLGLWLAALWPPQWLGHRLVDGHEPMAGRGDRGGGQRRHQPQLLATHPGDVGSGEFCRCHPQCPTPGAPQFCRGLLRLNLAPRGVPGCGGAAMAAMVGGNRRRLGADGPLCQRLTGGRPGICGLGWGERDQPLLAGSRRAAINAGVGLGILGLAIAVLVSNPRVRTLLQGLMGGGDSLLQIAGGDGPLVDRIFMAQAGFNLFQAHPLLGGGLGEYLAPV
jgi:putative inorganic carbon (HCO3(-)) transporter